ncbi:MULTISPECIES: LysR family transcriptional regulator [unclassified Halomonas]|uniref:LysR family transcriptional regulator n=1 Tax=unclassified Halomonas TaxID=2609666 RepID=UPI00288734FC|nr:MULTISPECIES: LysR family transcriptional regulator [unclassified Halomonas]MDT0499824.1 LysR family transcriptional regulator [Halomonas sp. PAR7]MDT0510359.1 LysR family transcriptional regulator [Halomonas sp. LES1]MDT0589932.1 LysR family transcriptional regulator [Halomonas sp. PAR8]
MLDRFTGMRVFTQAATHGSLSAAGRALGMSPAMATKHVDALEARLGVKLLHRTTRRLTLTDAGRDYLEACQRILQELDETESEVAAQRIEVVGRLRMNVPLSFGTRFIAPLLPAFSRRYPQVEVELGLSDAQHDLMQEGWDLALRIGHLADSSLKARRLGDCTLRVCAAPDYLERHGTPRGVNELAGHNCLSYTLSPSQKDGTWRFGRKGDIQVPVHSNLRANNGDALLAAALRGQGVIYQPSFIVDDALARGELVALELDQPTLDPGGIHVLLPPDRRPPAKVRAMIDYLVEALLP